MELLRVMPQGAIQTLLLSSAQAQTLTMAALPQRRP